jgi:hypothetical protein
MKRLLFVVCCLLFVVCCLLFVGRFGSKGSISSMGSRGWEISSVDVVFSPIIKGGKVLLEQNPLPYSLFLIPYLLFKHPLPRLKPCAMVNVVKIEIAKCWNLHTTSPLGDRGGCKKNPGCISQPGFLLFFG